MFRIHGYYLPFGEVSVICFLIAEINPRVGLKLYLVKALEKLDLTFVKTAELFSWDAEFGITKHKLLSFYENFCG